MDFNRMNIRNYHIYIKYVNTCNNHIVIKNLSNFRKHWIPVSQRDTTMSSWVSPTVLWRKEAWNIEILCPSSESFYIKSIICIYRLSMSVQDSTLLLWNQRCLCVWGGQCSWISCVTHTQQFVLDAPVTHQITSPRNPNNLWWPPWIWMIP